jgi:hypothetical protein
VSPLQTNPKPGKNDSEGEERKKKETINGGRRKGRKDMYIFPHLSLCK